MTAYLAFLLSPRTNVGSVSKNLKIITELFVDKKLTFLKPKSPLSENEWQQKVI